MKIKNLLFAVITVTYWYSWQTPNNCKKESYYDELSEKTEIYKNCLKKKKISKSFKSKSEARAFLNRNSWELQSPRFGHDLKRLPGEGTNHLLRINSEENFIGLEIYDGDILIYPEFKRLTQEVFDSK